MLIRGIYRFASDSHAIINLPATSMAGSTARSVGWYHKFRHARNRRMWWWEWGCTSKLKQLSALDYKQSNLQVQYSMDMLKVARRFLNFIPRYWYRGSPSPDLTIL